MNKNLCFAASWNDADGDGSLTSRLTEIEVSKAGYKINAKDWSEMTKGELLSERNELRRITNDFSDRATSLLGKGDKDGAEKMLKHAEEVARWSQLADRQIAMNEMAEEHSRGGGGGQMVSASGKRLRVIGRNDRFGDMSAADGSVEFGFGEFVAAMVNGTDRPDVRNALSEGTDSAGGYTVPKKLLSNIIDAMRARTVCVQAGALTVPLETQVTTIARIASDPLAGWRLENAAITESDPTFDSVTFNARSLAVLVKVSRELIADSVNIEQALTMAFAGAMAAELDRVALYGTGTAPEPRGIFNQSNINSVSMGTNGAQLSSYGKVLDCLYELQLDNAAEPSAAVMHPRTWRTIQGFADTTGQPLQRPPALVSLPLMATTSVPIDQVQGTAVNASSIIVGDFSQLLIGVRQELRIEVARELFAGNHQYAFIAHLRADVAVAQPGGFCKLIGITP